MTIQPNWLKKKTSKKSLNTIKNALGNQKKSWLLAIILLTSLRIKKRETSKTLYFNCNKKDYYASDYIKPKN